jgi:muconate cycloisomerase
VVQVTAEQGRIKGYGEGAPRSYVTGESLESVNRSIALFARDKCFPWQLNSVSQIWDFIDSLPDDGIHNSALCALEGALLDALGRHENQYVLNYFPKDYVSNAFSYGAALPLADKNGVLQVSRLIKGRGINKLKLKLGKDFNEIKAIFELVHSSFDNHYDLKVDVNGVWNSDITMRHLPLFQKYGVRILEQPVKPGDPQITEIANIAETSGLVLMADESACTLADVEKLSHEGFYGMVNVRLSKCGGLWKSLKIIDYLRQNDIAFQIGCHLGESGLLSAAGRVLCLLCSDALYYDGSYDEFLLKENITLENVSFGRGGKAHALNGAGLGVNIDLQSLHRLSNGASILTLSRP